jgi:phosphoribosylformimino-5-aminoimidazole carboxamide ribotide isomerase
VFERFTVIPSIDLKGGEVVRMTHGDLSRATVYSRDPVAVAREFDGGGAEIIHIVDIDGAVEGAPCNLESVRAIRRAVKCALDISGGLRTKDALRAAVAAGADYVSMGSAAVLNPELLRDACAALAGKVFGSLDVSGGKLVIKGWVEPGALSISDALARFRDAGVAAVIVTDVSRDGTEGGVDIGHAALQLRLTDLRVVASGGVASLADIGFLRNFFAQGLAGVVVGRALYEGRFRLSEALSVAWES